MADIQHICIVCGKEFIAHEGTEPICSQDCSDRIMDTIRSVKVEYYG